MNNPDSPTPGPRGRVPNRRSVTLRTSYAIERGRGIFAEKAFHAIRGGRRRTMLLLPYPPSAKNEPRWGHGKPSHARLSELLGQGVPDYEQVLRSFAAHTEDLMAIPVEKASPREPHWRNTLLFGLDGVSLYCFTRQREPKRYIEVGSGNSTLFVDRARRDGSLATHVTSIDPHPRREIDEICDTVIREPFESVSLDIFAPLQAGDIVYFDCSHRVFMNSDVVAFFLDVLPELPPGVLVGIHDVYLPDDYRAEHATRWWSEQYLLACLLLGEPGWMSTVLPCWYVSGNQQLAPLASALHPPEACSPLNPRGLIFWVQTQAR
jgi:hypothetical protein